MDIVFGRTRYDYQTYTDYWRLVELAGFETIWLDELEPGRDALYIVSPKNGEWGAGNDRDFLVIPLRLQGHHQCKVIWWCLERPDNTGTITHGAPLCEGFDQLWLSDRWLAQLEGWPRYPKAQFVPMGSDERLANPICMDSVHRYLWTHMSYANPRRLGIYDRLPGPVAPNAWGYERDAILGSTRFMVNVHQDDHLVCEPLRFALASAWAMPVLSEKCQDASPYEPTQFEYSRMVAEAKRPLLSNSNTERAIWRQIGERNWDIGCVHFPFRRCVETAVSSFLHWSQ